MTNISTNNELRPVIIRETSGNRREFVQHNEDDTLTKRQKTLKWSLYCECDMEDTEDVVAVLKSLLADQCDE